MRAQLAILTFAAAALLGSGCGDDQDSPGRAKAPAAAASTLATEPASTPATTPASTPDPAAEPECFVKDGLSLTSDDEGVCTFKDGKTKFRVVNRGTTAQLNQFDVKLDSVETASSISTAIGTARPDGVFLVVHLTVTNRVRGQLALNENLFAVSIGGDPYVPADNEDLYPLGDLMNYSTFGEFGPGISRKGRVIFDVSKANAKRYERVGSVFVSQPTDGGEADLAARSAALRFKS